MRSVVWLFALAGCNAAFGVREVPAPDAPTGYVAAVLADHPVGYFRLGETAGATAHDEIAGAPDGMYLEPVQRGVAGALANDPDGAIAVDDATMGHVEVGDHYDFPGAAPFTIEAWIDPASVTDGDYHMIASKWHEPAGRHGVELFQLDDEIRFTREVDDSTIDVVSASGLVASTYTHVVGTFDGAMLRLYFNGGLVAVGPSTVALADNDISFEIGLGGNAGFTGSIDEVAIYDHELPAERVLAHHDAAN